MYRISKARTVTKEEKVAAQITKLMSDLSLDLEAVGKYMAIATPYLIYCRSIEVLEAMQYNKEVAEYREQGGYYAQSLF